MNGSWIGNIYLYKPLEDVTNGVISTFRLALNDITTRMVGSILKTVLRMSVLGIVINTATDATSLLYTVTSKELPQNLEITYHLSISFGRFRWLVLGLILMIKQLRTADASGLEQIYYSVPLEQELFRASGLLEIWKGLFTKLFILVVLALLLDKYLLASVSKPLLYSPIDFRWNVLMDFGNHISIAYLMPY